MVSRIKISYNANNPTGTNTDNQSKSHNEQKTKTPLDTRLRHATRGIRCYKAAQKAAICQYLLGK